MTSSVSPVDHMRTLAVERTNNVMKSSQIWFGGCQSIMHSLAMDAQTRYELGCSTWAALTTAKSVHDAVSIQVDQACAAIQRNLDGSIRLGNASVKLVQDTLAPITANMKRSFEKAVVPGE